MAYQRVIPCGDVLREVNGAKYISSEAAADLLKREEQAIIHFNRQSRYTPLMDFPVKGGWRRVSQHSIIEGPMELEPEPTSEDSYERSRENIIKVVLVSRLPLKLTPIEFLEYGTAMDVERQKYINFMYASGIGGSPQELLFASKRLDKICEDVVIRIQKMFPPVSEEGTPLRLYRATDGESILELTVGIGNTYRYYHNVNLRAFGPAETTSRYIAKLGLDRLEEVFTTKDAREVGLENSLRRGFMLEQKKLTKIPSEFEENIVV